MKMFLEGDDGQIIVTNDTISVNKLLKSKKFRIIDADSFAVKTGTVTVRGEEDKAEVIRRDVPKRTP